MKKKTLTACAVVCTVSVLGGVCFERTKKQSISTANLLANVEALTETEEEFETRRSECYSNMEYNWNMASICVESGFEHVTCTVSGKISVFGVELSGSYVKDHIYTIPWARYQCEESNGNCCTKQGLYTGDTKLA